LLSQIYLTKEFVRKTIDSKNKKQIFFIGSMAYKAVLNASAPYCAAKAGLAHFANCIAWELAPKNYDVYTLHPSNTEDTPMTKHTIESVARYRGISMEDAEKYWGSVLPKDRWLQKEDIANLVNYLINDESGYLSGCNLEMKGGQR